MDHMPPAVRQLHRHDLHRDSILVLTQVHQLGDNVAAYVPLLD